MSGAASLLACVRAQVIADVTTRLRSTGTIVAILATLVVSFLWIPDPASGAVSISWSTLDGQRQTGFYTSSFVGTAAASLAAVFLSLIGFYLVAGAVRQDRESGVGAILAATPLSRFAYLLAKLAAHAVYLNAIGLTALASGIVVFLRYGSGSLALMDFVGPFLLLVPASLTFTAAVALFFDTTPGLRSRGGLVLYFFAWSFGLILLPIALSGGVERDAPYHGPIVFDPTGMATLMVQIEHQAGAKPGTASVGIEVHDEPMQRVEWRPLQASAALLGSRVLVFAWSLVPLLLGVLFFDRFDPARGRGSRRRGLWTRIRARFSAAPPTLDTGAAAPPRHIEHLETHPGTWLAVAAEARLVWLAASWVRWFLLVAAGAAAFIPENAPAVAAFLILLAPVLSEVAAREELAGLQGLIAAQPGVPRSRVLWKLAAVLLFVFTLALPLVVRTAIEGADRALAMVVGLAFVAVSAVVWGALTGGGKLFSALYTAHWYVALNGAGALDYCGAFGGGGGMGTRAAYVAACLVMTTLALAVERRREAA